MRTTRTRMWLGISAAVLGWNASELPRHGATDLFLPTIPTAQAAGEAGEKGESGERSEASGSGEAGEGGARHPTPDAARDDVSYLTALGLVEGHLRVGVELYRQAHHSTALSHMKHPGDEIYEDLLPAFRQRGVTGFAQLLEELAERVEHQAPVAEVNAALERVLQAVESAGSGATGRGEPATTLMVAHRLVRMAAREYDAGVKEGRVVDAHEYQDAYGFVLVAQRLVASLDGMGSDSVHRVVERADTALSGLHIAWPTLTGPESGPDASLLYGAAARLEIAASSL